MKEAEPGTRGWTRHDEGRVKLKRGCSLVVTLPETQSLTHLSSWMVWEDEFQVSFPFFGFRPVFRGDLVLVQGGYLVTWIYIYTHLA